MEKKKKEPEIRGVKPKKGRYSEVLKAIRIDAKLVKATNPAFDLLVVTI